MPNILVVGSMNMDIVTRVNRHPLPGETIHGLNTSFFSGGKGANQAVAAVRSGATVTMAGALGGDFFGNEISRLLLNDHINLKHVQKKCSMTGMAIITIDDSGENNIVLNEGANGKFMPEDLLDVELIQYDAILMQNEIPWETNAFILEKASVLNIKTVFNPAPALTIKDRYFPMIDLLILNEIEASEMTNIPVKDIESACKSALWLIEKGVSEVIITLGKQGAIYMDQNGSFFKSFAYNVTTVDTTAAGDTFIGAFVSACFNNDVADSLKYAAAAAALTVTKEGSQNSIPYLKQVDALIKETQDSLINV
ncbi:ribokinase [Neobacillus niacini]|uniref:ribokinase n=1 Tax=Neobacillus niacini TaxID=86668 RepID=UPI0027804170|nr:ribokinase [Neobacillus niacini]MDQ1000405.1 ribokinase [Neobacillus niacini]